MMDHPVKLLLNTHLHRKLFCMLFIGKKKLHISLILNVTNIKGPPLFNSSANLFVGIQHTCEMAWIKDKNGLIFLPS